MSEKLEISLSENALIHIFEYINLISLAKLRTVNFNWKNFIENEFRLWYKFFFTSDEVKPWRYQLIQMKYPSISYRNYDNLSNEQCKELFFSYISWRKVNNYAFSQIAFKDSDFFDNDENAITRIDTWANYIAFVGKSQNCVVMFDINTGESVMKLVRFNYQSFSLGNNDETFEGEDKFIIHRFKIFQLASDRLAFCIATYSVVFFWDVFQKRPILTPGVFQKKLLNRPIDISRGFDNDIYVTSYDVHKINVVRCKYDINSENIIAQKIIVINPPGTFYRFAFKDIFVKQKTMIMLLRIIDSTYLMEVEIPENLENPIEINENDKKYMKIIFTDKKQSDIFYGLSISNFNTVLGYSPQDSRLDILLRFKAVSTDQYTFIEKSYVMPTTFGRVIDLFFYMNNLYLVTEKGQLIIYKLKNLKHLLHLKLDKLLPKVIELPGIKKINSILSAESNNRPYMIISELLSTKILALQFN